MSDDSPEQAYTATGAPVPDPGSGQVTGTGGPMTGPQETHLRALCEEAGEEFDESMTSDQARERIEELEVRLPGRGQD